MKKTVLITGCSSGIGRASAYFFAQRGWQVVASMRNPDMAGDLIEQPNVRVLSLDVVDRISISNAVIHIEEEFGRLDVVVNNAGFGAFGPFETASVDLVDRQIATNLTGMMDVTRAVLPIMRRQNSGVVINIASVGGLTTMPLNAIYHATKYAVVGFTEGLNYELASFGIAAKFVAPGGVITDFAGRSLSLTFKGTGHAYTEIVEKVTQNFLQRTRQYSTPQDIAQVVFQAATDGKNQIRYVAGKDAEALLSARLQLGDMEYVRMMQERFGLID